MTSIASPMAPGSHSSNSSEDEESADTLSLSESVLDYPVHWDRRYHKFKEGSYSYPNDSQEQSRLDFQYSLTKAIQNGRLFFAPLQDPERILEVGTGTGIWCIELADSGLVPNARITGIDLSPIQPEEVPENVYFEVQDCSESDWGRTLNSYDMIYSRAMLGSLEDFSQYIRTARMYLKPGTGWLECTDIYPQPFADDGTMPETWGFKRWEELMDEGSRRAGRPTRMAHMIKQWMGEAGLVDIQEIIMKIPIGGWPADKELKMLGRGWAEMLLHTLPAVSYRTIHEQLLWSREQIEVMLADTRRSLHDKSVHSYHMLYTVFGRRPTETEEKSLGRMPPPPPPPSASAPAPAPAPAPGLNSH